MKWSLDIAENIKYLGLKAPLNQRWNEFATFPLDRGKRPYYAFENTCNGDELKCWFLMKYSFDTLVALLLLYVVEL